MPRGVREGANMCLVVGGKELTCASWWEERGKHVPRGGREGANMCLVVGGKELTCASWWAGRS